jgi:hypothetical protein
MRLYLAHPITGRSFEEVEAYYAEILGQLQGRYDCLYPMIGAGERRGETEFQPEGYHDPISTNQAILNRCQWMIQQSDLVLVDLTGSSRVSIGCVMEIAFARACARHIVAVLPPGNPHHHAMILAAVDVLFECREQALQYLDRLARRSID